MLRITVTGSEFYDEVNEQFVTYDDFDLDFEHSLVSLSKWESIWEKPYLSKDVKSTEEVFSYVECMILTPNFPPDAVTKLGQSNFDELGKYIDSKATATWFGDSSESPRSREVITAELIYYWLIALEIPIEVETWHLGRALALIKVCNAKNAKPKKTSPHQAAAERSRINDQRKAQMGTTG